MMTRVLAAATLLALLCLYAGAKSRYFVVGALIEARIENKACRYVMSSTPETYGARAGLVFVAVESCKARRLPNLRKGPIRIAANRDHLFFLDQDGRQHKARIVKRSPPRPPPIP